MEEASKLVSDASLAKFLKLRAEAFLSNDYVESDMAWMGMLVLLLSLLVFLLFPYLFSLSVVCSRRHRVFWRRPPSS